MEEEGEAGTGVWRKGRWERGKGEGEKGIGCEDATGKTRSLTFCKMEALVREGVRVEKREGREMRE